MKRLISLTALLVAVPLFAQSGRRIVGETSFASDQQTIPVVANVQGIASLTANRLERKIGEVPADVLRRIREALAFATGMV